MYFGSLSDLVKVKSYAIKKEGLQVIVGLLCFEVFVLFEHLGLMGKTLCLG